MIDGASLPNMRPPRKGGHRGILRRGLRCGSKSKIAGACPERIMMKFMPAAPGFAVVYEADTDEEWSYPLVGWDNDVPGDWDYPQPMFYDADEGRVVYAIHYGSFEIRETE